ncbi:hypothetical protein CEXT_752561 [Caerostris extrusa]|uniref:Uncharacterized protein n=1 Tax=Caerostris extrusa TaxID=172846 RepID=A0AAV4SAF3_CAEEX|nr:hypothetical protein CEXT_752561 [Caerostris extrusa]
MLPTDNVLLVFLRKKEGKRDTTGLGTFYFIYGIRPPPPPPPSSCTADIVCQRKCREIRYTPLCSKGFFNDYGKVVEAKEGDLIAFGFDENYWKGDLRGCAEEGQSLLQHNLEQWLEIVKTREYLPESIEKCSTTKCMQDLAAVCELIHRDESDDVMPKHEL